MNKPQKILSRSLRETLRLGSNFVKNLPAGTVVALEGDLGSGKTTFIKGMAASLGFKKDKVKSPTFALMHIYPTRPKLYHFDLYRLETRKELENLGLAEFFADPSAISCVEWAEKAGGLLPRNAWRVKFETTDRRSRRLTFRKSGSRAALNKTKVKNRDGPTDKTGTAGKIGEKKSR